MNFIILFLFYENGQILWNFSWGRNVGLNMSSCCVVFRNGLDLDLIIKLNTVSLIAMLGLLDLMHLGTDGEFGENIPDNFSRPCINFILIDLILVRLVEFDSF
jgi:hypothetical protein